MKDFPFIWLLFYTNTGKAILGIIIVCFIVMIAGWWLVPIIAALIGGVLLYEYYTSPKNTKKYINRKKNKLIAGYSFLIFALLFALGYTYYLYKKSMDDELLYYVPSETYEVVEDNSVPDSVATMETEKPKPVQARPSTSSSYSSSSSVDDDYDNMRGFDPASEDDMDDNGMSRYMENTDDEGWD